MGFLSKFEGKMEDTFENAASRMQKAPISPVQIMKKAEKQMRREKVVGAGKQFAPTLYTVLVNPEDDQRLFGFYPTLAGECETRIAASANAEGLSMDGHPLVRFIVDDGLKHGKFDIIAEVVSAPIVAQLRAEEMQRYGMGGAAPAKAPQSYGEAPVAPAPASAPRPYSDPAGFVAPAPQPQPQPQPQPMPAVVPAVVAAEIPQPQPQPNPAGFDAPTPQPMHNAPVPPVIDSPVEANGFEQQIFGAPGIDPLQPVSGGAFPDIQEQPEAKPPLPYVPENEIDYSIDYGEYTFDSQNFEDYRKNNDDEAVEPAAAEVETETEADVQAEEEAAAVVDEQQPETEVEFETEPEIENETEDAQADAGEQPSSDEYADGPVEETPIEETEDAAVAPGAENVAESAFQAPHDMGAQNMANPAYPQVDQAYGMPMNQNAYVPAGYAPQQNPAYGAYGQPAYGYAPGAQNPYQAMPYMQYPQQQMHQQAPAYGGVPHTVAFAAGAAQANPVANASAVRARLIDMKSNRSYDLATNRVLIGRETSNDIVLNDPNVSRHHAQIAFEPQGVWVLTDLGSTNGTFVNGMPVPRRGLSEGDRITLGMTELVFSLR